MNDIQQLRKWCLEQAFEKRRLMDVPHMECTNVAHQYYEWIVNGTSQMSGVIYEFEESKAS